jgi:hypothetical protein
VKSLPVFNLLIQNKLNKPPVSGVCCFLLVLLLGCTSIRIPGGKNKKANLTHGHYHEMDKDDFADHLSSLKLPFLSTPGVKEAKMDKFTDAYFRELLSEIIARNEIFFRELKSAQVTILDIESPLHFSLPKGEIFISRGLLAKYMKHESMLVSILSYELVRSEKLAYPKQTVIPVGYVTVERMLSLSRLTLDEKMEVHKWAHHLTVRSGYDGEYYLSWLQTQNRNTADFILQVGDPNIISREESLFKSFLIKNQLDDKLAVKKNSSKKFYSLMNRIRDGVI